MNNIDGFQKVCSLAELKESSGRRFIVDEEEVAIFNVDGNVYALNNVCPHQHSSLIHDGYIENEHVVCPAHGWKFNIKTGATLDGNKGLTTHQVLVLKDDVYVKTTKKYLKW